MSDIQEKISEEIKSARDVCSTDGNSADSCAAAWDAVEELQAEASHQKADAKPKTNFETYCDENPEADECRIYED
ncbi:Calvin cycle protein CP12 [Leptothoe kymatousa]|uniref:Calvin cycle protein CP12 n=1 Tax=Leptothoe kymatousa TAU-MAC 1615 TaxID=2364775 RepID=A0ABS5Y3D8_9CYAN|nr:Calvin cycle protein CP12 [Leptothoe kymatousa]MBT9312353.1 Calvin cycle protein CP12 [Leptothoe kymatousa TAU-MAC 1615]